MVELPFGGNPFSKRTKKTVHSQAKPTASFLTQQTIPPKKPSDRERLPKRREAPNAIKGGASKKGKAMDTSAPSSVSSAFGEIANNNFSAEDVKQWSGRTQAEAVFAFKQAVSETFFHGLNILSARESEVEQLNKSLAHSKEANELCKQKLGDAQKKAAGEVSALQKEIDRLNGVLGEAAEEAKKREALHAEQLTEIKATLNAYESDRDKDLSDAYTSGFLGYLKSFLGVHPDYDWSLTFPPSTVQYMEKFKVDNAEAITEERATIEAKKQAELEAIAEGEAKKPETNPGEEEGEEDQEASSKEAV